MVDQSIEPQGGHVRDTHLQSRHGIGGDQAVGKDPAYDLMRERVRQEMQVGHALIAARQKGTEPVSKITIVPHTQGSLGYTLLMPEEDKTNLRTRDELMAKIAVSMGGRAAEEVVMNTMTNGASQDIQEATSIARNMVAMYGMSDEFDMVALETVNNQYLGGDTSLACSAQTQREIDQKVVALVKAQHQKAIQILTDNREKLDELAKYLYQKETITGDEFMEILDSPQ